MRAAAAAVAVLSLAGRVAGALELTRDELRLIEADDVGALAAALDRAPARANATSYREGRCSALAYAAALGHVRTAMLLAARGADLEARCHEQRFTPLMLAALCSNQHQVNHSLCPRHLHLASVSQRDSDSHNQVATELLRLGASAAATTREGQQAAHLAALNGDAAALAILLAAGAEPDARDAYGWSPLLYAVQRGDQEAVALLLRAGADPNRADSLSVSPLKHAMHLKRKHMARQLVEGGAHCSAADLEQIREL
jgi:ankyrin repeat protein